VAIICSIAVVSIAVIDHNADNRQDRVDALSTGPYLVENIQANPPTFLYWRNDSKGFSLIKLTRAWTHDLSLAWRFADRESAMEDAQKYGGLAVALREISR